MRARGQRLSRRVGRQVANNFLGLVGNGKIAADCRQVIEKYGVGSCGPRGFYGKDCYFRVFMGLFLLNLPCTHREIDCYFLDSSWDFSR
eukprot:SAG31_NODE_918_length_11020_cov_14.801392_7_plen_89_part_00